MLIEVFGGCVGGAWGAGTTHAQVIASLLTRDFPQPAPHVPLHVRDIIHGCLQNDTGARWDAARVADALEHFEA